MFQAATLFLISKVVSLTVRQHCIILIWHLEIEDMLVLKNNKGTEENRVRHMDYGVQFNKLMYERLITNDNITFFNQ